MKKTALLIAFLSCGLGAFSQENYEEMLKENSRLKELAAYYDHPKSMSMQGVEFSFFRAVGSVKDKSVTVEFLVKNTNDANLTIKFDDVQIIDEANSSRIISKTPAPKLGTNPAIHYNKLVSNVPLKYTAVISNVNPDDFQLVKHIAVDIYVQQPDLGESYDQVAISGDQVEWK